jgi:hypothetical protein
MKRVPLTYFGEKRPPWTTKIWRDGNSITPTMYSHTVPTNSHWIRQSDAARHVMKEEQVFEISQVPVSDPTRRPEIVAMTSKTSAQRLISALSERTDTGYRYAVTAVFLHPILPGLQRPEIPSWYIEQQAGRERQAQRMGMEH